MSSAIGYSTATLPPAQPVQPGVRYAPRSDTQQMLVRLGHERFEPALIEMSCSHRLPMGMPPLRMGERESVLQSRQIAILSGPDDEMPVVGHDAVR